MTAVQWPGLHSAPAFRSIDQLTGSKASAFFDALDGLNLADAERERQGAEIEQLRSTLAAVRRSHDEWADLAQLLVDRIDEITTASAAHRAAADRPAPCEEAGAGHFTTTP